MNISTLLELAVIATGSFILVKVFQFFFQNQFGKNFGSKDFDYWLFAEQLICTLLIVMWLEVFYGKFSIGLSLALVLSVGLLIGLRKFFWSLIQGYWMSRKIHVNDFYEVNGELAKVIKVGIRTFVISINNTSQLLVPMRKVNRLKLVNLTQEKKPFKVHFSFDTSDAVDIATIEKTVLKIMGKKKKILQAPKPHISIVDLGNELIVFHIYFHTHHFYSIDDITTEIKLKIMKYFIKKNITHLFRKNDSLQKMKEHLSKN